jgi:hypothetical protein
VAFTGDQLGALFAGRILAQYKASGKPLGTSRPLPLDVVLIVRPGHRKALHGGIHRELQDDRSYGSGRRIQLHRVSHWFVFVVYTGRVRFTINYRFSGFKYIGNSALTLVEQGFEVPFGYEEAIGFMIGSQIRDKDGVAAAV